VTPDELRAFAYDAYYTVMSMTLMLTDMPPPEAEWRRKKVDAMIDAGNAIIRRWEKGNTIKRGPERD
jgi:hypothetical protein